MMHYYYGFGDMFGWGGVMMLLVWVVIIIGVVWAIREFGSHSQDRKGNSALDILKERYVKGEINKEEFEAKKKDILN